MEQMKSPEMKEQELDQMIQTGSDLTKGKEGNIYTPGRGAGVH